MASQATLTKEQNAAMKKEFLQLDADGDGEISTEEIEKVLRAMRIKLKASEGDIKCAIRDIDRDGDGTIDMSEYLGNRCNATNRNLIHRALVQRSRIRKEFAVFDADKNGVISKEEFLQIIKERGVISPDHVDKLIKETDADGNGEIDFEEFVIMMTQ